MGPIHVRARYDGHVLVLEEPADLPQGVVLELSVSPMEERSPREPGSAKGKIWMSDDFDAPLEDFAEYR